MHSLRAAAVLAVLLVACGSERRPVPPAADDPPLRRAEVYVAVGASETAGVGADLPEQAWPEVLRRTKLPAGTAFANLGIPGATVSRALAEELPPALAAAPTLVTVWLNVNDLVAGVPPAAYEAQLRRLVHGLRRDGATRVLVANTPALELLPAYLACTDRPQLGVCPAGLALPPPGTVAAAVAAYNEAVRRVADAEGAVLVDLHQASVRSHRSGRLPQLVSADGFHPSTLGHQAVADVFAQAL